MTLQPSIDSRLWAAISQSYEDGNYSVAVSEAFYFLSDLIRAKSGLDSDGAQLVGTAFGGEIPVIKVNAFQTETDKSEQRGIEQVLRGLYMGFRNPRSHEKRVDTQATADAIVSFVSFIVGLIDLSKSPFDIEQIAQQVFDKHFVASEEYATAIASRIPVGKRFDVLVEIFNRRQYGKTEHTTIFCRALLTMLPTGSQSAFWEVVSQALEAATGELDTRSAVSIAGADWAKLSDVARLRTENRLIASIREGEYDSVAKSCLRGSLGTWAISIAPNFLSKPQLRSSLIERLGVGSAATKYILRFFKNVLFISTEPLDLELEWAIAARLHADDRLVYEALPSFSAADTHDSWKTELKEAVDDFESRNPHLLDEDIPF